MIGFIPERVIDFTGMRSLGRVPVMRAPVGVQARRQTPTLDDLRHPPKARRGPLLLDEEHRVVLTGRKRPGNGAIDAD